VCSIALDRDDEFFATAGVSKRMRIYEYKSVAEGSPGTQYPVLDVSSRSRLSSVCWSSYVKAHMLSADYEGVVSLWDVHSGAEVMQFEEHCKRVWSVDFSKVGAPRGCRGCCCCC
jgi:protein suppressor of PHYA-105 1